MRKTMGSPELCDARGASIFIEHAQSAGNAPFGRVFTSLQPCSQPRLLWLCGLHCRDTYCTAVHSQLYSADKNRYRSKTFAQFMFTVLCLLLDATMTRRPDRTLIMNEKLKRQCTVADRNRPRTNSHACGERESKNLQERTRRIHPWTDLSSWTRGARSDACEGAQRFAIENFSVRLE